MNRELIAKAEAFLKETYGASARMQAHPAQRIYRLEHAYRVANIAKTIAEEEGFNVTYAVLGGLLHDIAYCEEMPSREEWMTHGRRGAAMARPFLESLGLPEEAVNDICYSIAIHVDDQADFEWERSPFSEIVGDADNIDRIDAYRIYESLEYHKFSAMTLEEKQEKVAATIQKMADFKKISLGSPTARKLWLQRVEYYADFYEKLKAQLAYSNEIQ